MTADSLPIIRVAYESISFKPQAQVLAEKLSLPIQVDTDAFANSFDYLLEFTQCASGYNHIEVLPLRSSPFWRRK